MGVSVKIPVLSVVGRACRNTLRFATRHPALLLTTLALSMPFEIVRSAWGLDEIDRSSASAFGASWLLSAILLVIWLPVFVMAVRETVCSEIVSLSPRLIRSVSTYRYGLCAFGVLLISELLAAIPTGSFAGASFVFVGSIALCFIIVRTTLTCSALALGRLDLGLVQSYRRTAGQTLRLSAVAMLPMIIVGLIGFAPIIVAVLAGFDLADPENAKEPALPTRVGLGVVSQVMALSIVIAGGEVYRLIEGAPAEPQNGRY